MIRTATSRTPLLSAARAAGAGLAAIALFSAAPAAADESEEPAAEMSKGEEKLARLLEGRVAGEPQDCINSFNTNRMKTIEETAYVYGGGRTIYVQYTRRPEDIDRDDVLVVRKFNGARLCRLDFVSTIDRHARFFTGAVQFEQFIPYTRVEEDEG